MNDVFTLVAKHGYSIICAVVFAEAIGLPVPAALALVAGGAAASARVLHAPLVLMVALAAMLVADCLLYILGRYMGWGLLGLLCKVSVNPETCILRSAESFYKRGKRTLVFAKFIPGINTMAPPLAGSMKMRFGQFVQLDLAGASLYSLAYFGLGFVFRNFFAAITRGFQAASHGLEIALLFAFVAFIVYRVKQYQKYRIYRVVPHVQVEELALKLASQEKDTILLVDVRSHGYYDPDAARIQGSIRIEPNNLTEEVERLPKDKDIYLYCT